MRFAVKTRPEHQTWEELRDIWVAADEVPLFESIWNWDHFYPLTGDLHGPNFEGWTMLAAMAALTSRIRIGASSANNDLEVTAFRNTNGSVAVVVLNTATTAQQASFGLQGVAAGPVAIPYLTDASSDTAGQRPVAVTHGSFEMDLPARSLVTFYLPAH